MVYDGIVYYSKLAYLLINNNTINLLLFQIYQFLYEAGYGSSKFHGRSGVIGVTQPRRVAVLATAKRVAHELGLRLGKEVGFQVRYDKKIGDNCSIKFMTDGILLREVQVVIFYLDMFPICSFYGVLLSSL
jgi:HrpA-like RNA helicase